MDTGGLTGGSALPEADDPVDLLVVGAGPAGLALALEAADHGARVRVVERRPDPSRPSRAMILHPRTLEVLRSLGVTDALLAHAVPSTAVQVHLGPRTIEARLDTFGLAMSRFPHPVLIRQSDVEAVLAQALAARRIPVERGVELVGFASDAHLVTAELRGSVAGAASCRYLAGCDGAVSTVRGLAGIEWAGGVYRSEVVLADVDLRGAVEPLARLVPTAAGLMFLFPLGEQAAWRLLATRPVTEPAAEPGQFGPALTAADLQTLLTSADLPVQIDSVAWSSRIRLPHRLAAAFRRGRVFLIGDAAHAHSPAGGQGMNTGLQDAVNLGWKVAYASRAGAPEDCPLLASYDRERRPVAQRVRALTRMLFWAEAGTGPLPSLARGRAVPHAAGLLAEVVRHRRPGAAWVWLLAQFWVNYRASPLTNDTRPRRLGRPWAGDRLPDESVVVSGRAVRLHDLLASPGLHVLLDRDAAGVEQVLADPDLGVHRLTSWPGHGGHGDPSRRLHRLPRGDGRPASGPGLAGSGSGEGPSSLSVSIPGCQIHDHVAGTGHAQAAPRLRQPPGRQRSAGDEHRRTAVPTRHPRRAPPRVARSPSSTGAALVVSHQLSLWIGPATR